MSRLLTHKGRLACGVAMLLTVSLCSCIAEHESVPETGGDREAAFILNVPGMNVPLTRALDPAKEQEVTEIDVVIFNAVDRTLAEYHRVAAIDLTPVTGGDGWQCKIHNIETSTNITAAVIANASLEVSEALAAVTQNGTYLGADKAGFLDALEVAVGTKWNTTGTGYWKIPMYGEARIAGSIYSGTLHEVNLTRMLAKVDIVNTVAPAGVPVAGNFKLTAVHVVNYNARGRIAPAWDTQGDIQLGATIPNLPSYTGKCVWMDGNELTYTTSSSTAPIENEIYLFEAAAMSENTTTPNGLRLVFEGEFTSVDGTEHYYYPVDFTAPYDTQTGKAYYIPVLRNNRYLFTITEASGRGYDSLGEAAMALGVMSNLRTRVLVVDESGIRNIVWNGGYFLGLADNEVILGESLAGSTVNVKCTTNYADGWMVDRIEYQGMQTNWLKVDKSGSSSDMHSDLELTPLVVNGSGTERTAIVYIKAGRLTNKLTVTQQASEGLFVGRFGGQLKPDANGVWQYEKMLYVQNSNEGSLVRWKTTNTATVNVASDWDGRQNTWSMTSSPTLRDEHPVAKLCYYKNYMPTNINELNWFLPSQKQLMAVWISRNGLNIVAYPIDHKVYWSSTEYDITHPWGVNMFSGGTSTDMDKRSTSPVVRCVMEY